MPAMTATSLYEVAAELSATAADLAAAIDTGEPTGPLTRRASDLLTTLALALGAAPPPPVGTPPPATIYLAARYSRRLELCGYRTDLARLGITVTSRWLNGNHQVDDQGVPIGDNGERIFETCDTAVPKWRRWFAEHDVADVLAADMLVAFTEEPRATATRGGRHVELGLALGAGKQVAVIGPRENLFCWLPCVEHYPTWAAFMADLTGCAPAAPVGGAV